MPRKEKEDLSERYNIFETDEFLKRLTKFSVNDKKFIEAKLKTLIYDQLHLEPHFGNNIKKLRSYTPETWRFRIGKYRLFYSINEVDKIVFILTVEFRKDAY
jgi:mRNA interferase RelE/StbE